jgi:hypothetical protein
MWSQNFCYTFSKSICGAKDYYTFIEGFGTILQWMRIGFGSTFPKGGCGFTNSLLDNRLPLLLVHQPHPYFH